jgi:methanol dehydrogenase (cytochrome c) subunit 2
MKQLFILTALSLAAFFSSSAFAYDGTHCKEPGVCWEAKPGYPAKVAGSQYDPKHDVNELNKQAQSIKEMEARNQQRSQYLAQTGKFVYDVEEIPAQAKASASTPAPAASVPAKAKPPAPIKVKEAAPKK